MYNMSGSASSAKFRRDRLEASQTNRQKLSESNSVACARPQAPALLNNNNTNNTNNKQALYDDTRQGQGQGQLTQININKSDTDLRALGAMPPVTILKLHEQRLNLNATLLAQLTKQVEDCQKIKPVPLNNTPNTSTNTHSSNELALIFRITDLEQKMLRLLQPSTISTPVVGVPEVSKQQFDALSLKCTNMEGQLITLMTTMHSLTEQQSSNQTKQLGTDEHVKQEKQEKQEKRIDLLQSLIVTQRDLVSDISVLVKTFSDSQKPCSCEPIINNQLDGICMSKGTQSFPFSGQDVLPLLSVLPAIDVVSVLPEVVTLTEVNVDAVKADELLSNEPDLSDVTIDVTIDVINDVTIDVINDTAEPSLVLHGESDTINVVCLSIEPTPSTSESKVDSKDDIQKTPTQGIKSGRKSKRTVVSI